jgi:hypothetical protein
LNASPVDEWEPTAGDVREVAAGLLYLLLLIRFRVPLQLAAFGQALRRRPADRAADIAS